MALFFNRHFDQAAEMFAMSVREGGFLAAYRALASCYGHLGRLDEARAVIERLRAIAPNVMSRPVAHMNPEQRELYLSGLRLAMGETR
jgi:pentatricopeptide repeat protein